MRVHFIVHESFEAPGAYETWAINQGHDVTYSRVYAGDRLPDDAVGIDFLVVMGGPQDPDTTLEACPHFNAKALRAHDYSEMNQLLFGFLAFWLFGFLAFWLFGFLDKLEARYKAAQAYCHAR
ncbi:glutamine amidotransferase class-I [Klebsiella pneumoniae]|nr:glutamine amidotransferase class-I [Klebsiella pneumoniae]